MAKPSKSAELKAKYKKEFDKSKRNITEYLVFKKVVKAT